MIRWLCLVRAVANDCLAAIKRLDESAEPRCGARGLCAPQLESLGRARANESRSCRRGSRRTPRNGHERFQIVRQPRVEPCGERRTGSKALGAPWKHATVVEDEDAQEAIWYVVSGQGEPGFSSVWWPQGHRGLP